MDERERSAVAKIASGIRINGTYNIGARLKLILPPNGVIECPICSTSRDKQPMRLCEEQNQLADSPMLWRICSNCGFNFPGRWELTGPRTTTLIHERRAVMRQIR